MFFACCCARYPWQLEVQAYYMLDELLVGGKIQETSKKNIVRAITAQDMLQEVGVVLQINVHCSFYSNQL